MKQAMKRTVLLLTTLALLLSGMCVPAFAALPERVEPRWIYIDNTVEDMYFLGQTQGVAYVHLTGKVGTTRIQGSGIVYKMVDGEWEAVARLNRDVEADSCLVEILFDSEVGYEYRAEFYFIVYHGERCETFSTSIYRTCA